MAASRARRVVERVERGGELLEVVAEHVRRMFLRSERKRGGIFGDLGHQGTGLFAREARQIGFGKRFVARNGKALFLSQGERRVKIHIIHYHFI